mmetsp:Transcript_68940/g.202373  ORF Transcript_68940/g.202373 Transcript_68940/m.202373 type:complete len:248 (-) Transcript_68940:570-1313(-)
MVAEHVHVDAGHGLPDVLGDLGQDLGVLVVRHGLDDRPGALRRLRGLEDAAADEDAVDAQLHAEGGVRGRGHATGGEVDHGKLAVLLDLLEEVQGRPHLLGEGEELVLVHGLDHADLLVQRADVAHRLDDVAGAGLALRADHARALGDAAERLAQVAAPAHEGDLELVLVEVVVLVGDGEHLALVHAIHAEVLEDLRLDEVPDPDLGHDRDGHRVDNVLDHLGIGRARHALLEPDVGGGALKGPSSP